MVYKRKQIFISSLLSLLLILFLFSNIGRSYLISFVHVVRGDDVVAENLPSESEDKILNIDGEDDLVKEDSEENSEENLSTLDDSTSSKETSLNEENVLEDSKEEPVDNGEIKTDDDAISEEVALEEENDQSELPVISENEKNDINTREGGTRLGAPITAFVNVVNNTSSTPALNATSFSFVHTNDDGSNTINIDENCSPDYMSCNEKIDSTFSGASHFFNLEHTEYLDYHTEGFSCTGYYSGTVSPLPIAATSLLEPDKCTITYEYVEPNVNITTPDSGSTSVIFNNGTLQWGNGIKQEDVTSWKVNYSPAPFKNVTPDNPCYMVESISPYPNGRICYTFEGECSGDTFDNTQEKHCEIGQDKTENSGSYMQISVNAIAVKKYPPTIDEDYEEDLYESTWAPTMLDVDSNPFMIINQISFPPPHGIYPTTYYAKIFQTYNPHVPMRLSSGQIKGYEFLGCKERNTSNPLQTELSYNTSFDVTSEIDCFYKKLSPQLTIMKTNNSPVEGSEAGDIVEFQIKVEAPNDDKEGQYYLWTTDILDKLPKGFEYISGSYKLVSTLRGQILTTEPEYTEGDWAGWDIGGLEEGEIVTLTYNAKIQKGLPQGTYSGQAYVRGTSIDGSILGIGDNGTEFAESKVNVVTRTIVNESKGVKLPNTGASVYLSVLGILPILIGILLLKIATKNINLVSFTKK